MNRFINTLIAIDTTLATHGIPYVIIGGLAVQHWGEARFTRDIDITLMVQPGEEEAVIDLLQTSFNPRMADFRNFAIQNRVMPVSSHDGTDIDISFGLPGYEEFVLQRAVMIQIAENRYPVCSAEDLIIHKLVAGRPIDKSDIVSIILRNDSHLDMDYLREWLDCFSQLLEGDDLFSEFQILRSQATSSSCSI